MANHRIWIKLTYGYKSRKKGIVCDSCGIPLSFATLEEAQSFWAKYQRKFISPSSSKPSVYAQNTTCTFQENPTKGSTNQKLLSLIKQGKFSPISPQTGFLFAHLDDK